MTPYTPSAERPWNRPRAAHLLRRAGFAPTAAELQRALQEEPAATVARLIDGEPQSPRHDELDEMGAALAARDDIDALRGWWLLRMCHTRRPLHARMAAFWHNHFATSNTKVRSSTMMLQQLRTIERLGLGRFEELLLAVSRDPAMILWLDGEQNIKGRPNENYARELFELFALGVGNYSERDIKEAARAFTGWHQQRGQFRFVRSEHDAGSKRLFGETGNFGGEEVVRLTVQQKACASFIAGKLLREFVTPTPSAVLVAETAAELRRNGFDISATLRFVLGSEEFLGGEGPAELPPYFRERIKSPVEFVVGVVRCLELRVPAGVLGEQVSQMGQRLLEPPSVKGWDGDRAWLNSATMLVRLNAVVRCTAAGQGGFDPAGLRGRGEIDDSAAAVAYCANLALDGVVPPALQRELGELRGGPGEVMCAALRRLLGSPEYQLA